MPSCPLEIYYQNVRGLNTKIQEFFVSACDLFYDVVVLTETWLSDSVHSSELFPNYYSIARCDRSFAVVNRTRGGGVLIAFSPKINFKVIDTSHITGLVPLIDLVLCWCSVGCVNFHVAAVYVPPDISCSDLELFTDALELCLSDNHFILLGDFNIPSLMIPTVRSIKKTCFENFISSLNISQHNLIGNHNNIILDLVLSDGDTRLDVLRCDGPLVPEDLHHPALCATFDVSPGRRAAAFPTANDLAYDFRRANFPALYADLCDVCWAFLGGFCDVDLCVDAFYAVLYSVLDRHVPRRRVGRSHFPPWYTGEIKRNLKSKNYFRSRWIKTGNCYYQREFKRLRSLVKTQIMSAYSEYTARAENDIKTNPGHLWNFLNDKRGSTRIPGVLNNGTTDLTNPSEIVDAFADTFSGAYSDPGAASYTVRHSDCLSFSVLPVTEEELVRILSRSKNKLTSGADMVPSFLLRDCKHIFARPLSIIINISIKSGRFPDRWKIARICPVHKKGDASRISNYRPISILSNFSKVYEQYLYIAIYYNVCRYMSPHQHGFMTGRSTVTNLATISQYICEVLDRRGRVDVVYTDFTHAFDTINHDLLLNKLRSFGFAPQSLRIVESYLSGRRSYVSYNGFDSRTFGVSVGVPQGSNLGPLLFNLFVNDVLELFTCEVLGYADDLKLYAEIASPADALHLQDNLEMLVDWCHNNGLVLNIGKCCVVTYTRSSSPAGMRYEIAGEVLQSKSSFCDLGVMFDSKFRFVEHIESVCTRAHRTLGFIMRVSRNFRSVATIKSLYYAYVMSKLEYASLIWSPIYTSHSLQLERIQRKMLKYISFRIDGTYPVNGTGHPELLVRHGMSSLTERRDNAFVKFLIKLMKGDIDCNYLMSAIPFNVPRLSARSCSTFRLPPARTNALSRSPVALLCRSADRLITDIFLV